MSVRPPRRRPVTAPRSTCGRGRGARLGTLGDHCVDTSRSGMTGLVERADLDEQLRARRPRLFDEGGRITPKQHQHRHLLVQAQSDSPFDRRGRVTISETGDDHIDAERSRRSAHDAIDLAAHRLDR